MSQDKYILAFDQGTTSSRSIIFDHDGKVVAVAQKEFQQIYPKPGWVEHDPMEIWSSQSSTAAEAISRADLSADSIAAVGVTNQRETTIVWDKKTGKPVYNAIVWQDRRTADYCRKLKEDGIEAMVSEKTGLRLDPYFAGTKVRWILENVEGARARAEAGELLFGTVDSWLVWQLTGHKVHVTDITNASRTLFYNIEQDGWDDELLELFGVPRSMLPEIKSCSEVYGHVEKNLYPGGAPIAGIAGDQHAALFGQACFEPGMAKNTYGTGCFLLMNMGEKPIRSKNNLLTTVAWRIGDKTEYALEGSIFIGGAVVQWIRDELQLVRTAQELDALAATVEDAGGLFLVPAFAGLGAPHWDPYARGAALGITRGTNRAHFCRAALESIAFQSADLITAMEKDSGISLKELRVDGGACQSDPLLQFQADLLQTEVIRPKCIETTALGAAYLAGLAVGFWKSRDSITKRWEQERSFEPQRKAEDMTALTAGWNKALERSKKWEDAVDE
ncbi:glycerol kinase GlpK [Coraliomargarita sp. SDUM461003]|uniref:Glycerol kinase n=1 Tax=Thalassobacterium maritimum TaxID=3041265 RepID=A0ABU1ARG5_9BACT|nr:glycerol kinase GlpK [Coraliomargarita sp. SDUM461003]MBT61911.1 glycerol kinase [Puniceicoccaceae bacterium]MDQ8206749.1 glycerol kinase GlpK [Coraliomargarita sp. SDUM461003]|tara:strand:- start:2749 stop:4257 length:1509 start_codon:yes stop_codon:yes gene_type:complete